MRKSQLLAVINCNYIQIVICEERSSAVVITKWRPAMSEAHTHSCSMIMCKYLFNV